MVLFVSEQLLINKIWKCCWSFLFGHACTCVCLAPLLGEKVWWNINNLKEICFSNRSVCERLPYGDQSVNGVQQNMQRSLPNYIIFLLWGGCKAKKITSLREDIWCFWWHFYHHQGEVFLAPWYCYVLILLWCELFKAKSSRKLSIHWIAQLVSLTFICWIAIYLVDSAIQHLNNRALLSNTNCLLPKQ